MFKTFVFIIDVVFSFGVLVLFALSPADKASSLAAILLAGPGPVLAVLNGGISFATIMDKRSAKAGRK